MTVAEEVTPSIVRIPNLLFITYRRSLTKVSSIIRSSKNAWEVNFAKPLLNNRVPQPHMWQEIQGLEQGDLFLTGSDHGAAQSGYQQLIGPVLSGKNRWTIYNVFTDNLPN